MDDVRMDDVKIDDVRQYLKKTMILISGFFLMVMKNWKNIYPHKNFHLNFFLTISCQLLLFCSFIQIGIR